MTGDDFSVQRQKSGQAGSLSHSQGQSSHLVDYLSNILRYVTRDRVFFIFRKCLTRTQDKKAGTGLPHSPGRYVHSVDTVDRECTRCIYARSTRLILLFLLHSLRCIPRDVLLCAGLADKKTSTMNTSTRVRLVGVCHKPELGLWRVICQS